MAPVDIRPPGYIPQGTFSGTIPGEKSIERRRRLAEVLAQQGTSTAPVQHWTQGAARVAQSLASVLGNYQANQMEQQRGSALQQALSGGATPDQLMASMDPDLQRIAVYRAQQAQEAAAAERQAAQDARNESHFQATFGQKEREINKPNYRFSGGQYFNADQPEAGAQPIPGYTPEQELPKASDVLPVIKDYNNQPGVSGYRAVNPMLHSMHKSLSDPSAVADLDFVYGVAKVMDPQSVVRESEQGNIIASQSIPQSLLGQLNKFMLGQQVLSPDVRRQLYGVARRRAAEMQAQGETERNFYLKFGKTYGLGEDQFRALEPLPPEAGEPTASPSPGAQAAPAIHKNIPFRIMP